MRKRWPDIIFTDHASRASLSRAAKTGSIARIGPGIYTGRHLAEPARVARDHWRQIVSHELPGAVLADRSARTTGPDEHGRLFVVHARSRPLLLPGLSILVRRGPTMVEGDIDIGDGLRQSSAARGLLDNLSADRERFLGDAEVERWVGDILDIGGTSRLNQIRDEARRLAPAIGRERAMRRLDGIIAAALATGAGDVLATRALRSRATSEPIDARRLDLFEALTSHLRDQPPEVLLDDAALADRRALLPFYEAYFSNYIEGTEFTLDEAADIALAGRIPADRPADAHDIAGTYRVTSDPVEMARVPASPDDLMDLLRERHRSVMEGRPDQRRGLFKLTANRAGATHVAPDKVVGTLRAGFDAGAQLRWPLARAVFVMFLVSEVHPFGDGNGRVARLMANAELVSAGEVRLVIPTVYRNNYIAALNAASHNATFGPLFDALSFARRYTARIDFTDRRAAESDLARTNALMTPEWAEANGLRLRMPG